MYLISVLYRIAFFTNDLIPISNELCYDYGYMEGNVEDRKLACLCGSDDCRKNLY